MDPAAFIRRDIPHGQPSVEISLVWAVETDMAVFAKAEEGDVDGGGGEECGVACYRSLDIGRVAVEIGGGARGKAVGQVRTTLVAEARTVLAGRLTKTSTRGQ